MSKKNIAALLINHCFENIPVFNTSIIFHKFFQLLHIFQLFYLLSSSANCFVFSMMRWQDLVKYLNCKHLRFSNFYSLPILNFVIGWILQLKYYKLIWEHWANIVNMQVYTYLEYLHNIFKIFKIFAKFTIQIFWIGKYFSSNNAIQICSSNQANISKQFNAG